VRALLSILLLFSLRLAFAQEQVTSYPKIAGYFSIVHPIVSWSDQETTTNFSQSYTVGFPTGINLLKSDKLAFSFEITPFIRAENGSSKMYNTLFHPGIIFLFKNGIGLTARAEFESSGRYGMTGVLSKVVKKNKNGSYFVAVPMPIRYGNNKAASLGFAVQVGISF
jgi:hypothetical protein